MQTRPTIPEIKKGRTTVTYFIRHIFTPTPAIAGRIAEIAAFLSDKDLPPAHRAAVARNLKRPDPLAEVETLDIAASHYREACRQIVAALATSPDTADRTYARIAAERIDTDSPTEIRSRFRQLSLMRSRR